MRAGLTAELESRGLTPQVLVNNAGFSTLGPVHSSDPADELKMIEVDVAAVADLCSRFLPGMVERGEGAVLNVASTAAFQPLPGQAGYGAAKAFVLSYSRSISEVLKRTGVTVTVLFPGPVSTGFGQAAGFTKEQEENALPGFMWVSSADVAKTAVEGMEKGTLVVIPGLANRAGAAFAHLMPKRVLMPILASSTPAFPDPAAWLRRRARAGRTRRLPTARLAGGPCRGDSPARTPRRRAAPRVAFTRARTPSPVEPARRGGSAPLVTRRP